MDPEEKLYDKSDSWSLTVLLFQLACNRLPFGSIKDPIAYLSNTRKAKFNFTLQEKQKLSDEFRDLV